MRLERGRYRVYKPETKECLLRPPDSVAKPEPLSLKQDKTDWEASTLPLSYTRV